MGAWVPIQLWGGSLYSLGVEGSLCGLRVPKQFRGIPVQLGVGFWGGSLCVRGSLGVWASWGIPAQFVGGSQCGSGVPVCFGEALV